MAAQEEDEFEEATPEQKRDVARHFLLSSPNGQVKEVAKDLKKLVGSTLSPDFLVSTLRDYHKASFQVPKTKKGGDGSSRVIVSGVSERGDDKYFDPESNKLYTLNVKTGQVTAEEDAKEDLDGEVEEYRSQTQTAVRGYYDSVYEKNKGTCAVFGNDDGTLTIIISTKNLNLANYWSGGWYSFWKVSVAEQGEVTLSGTVRSNVHYFEDGNVQLNTSYKPSKKVTVSDPESTGKAVADAIMKLEMDLHKNLEAYYVRLHDHTFKAMRRFRPKTGTKFDWKSASHKIAREIGK